MRRLLLLAVALSVVGGSARAEGDEGGLGMLRRLAGSWSGAAHAAGVGGKKVTTRAIFRVVSGGSAVMLTTDSGTPHEMVTLFHEDDGALVATHYCAAQNQPRFRAEPGDGKKLVFEFQDGTNLGAHPGRMQRLVLTVLGPDHHQEEWTYRQGEEESTMLFDLRRKK